jgi:Uma2 family endonuclease
MVAKVKASSKRGTTPHERLYSVEEYHRMADAGVFAPDERVELLEGRVIVMAAQNTPHAIAVSRTDHILRRVFPQRSFGVWVSAPLQFPAIDSEPEPDLSILRGPLEDHLDRQNPRRKPSTALLVIEVSDTTLVEDRGRKKQIYAKAGIEDYWIVNLVDSVLEVHRSPEGSSYSSVRVLRPGESIAPLAAPRNRKIRVADLLP